jgi:hypothetical protein
VTLWFFTRSSYLISNYVREANKIYVPGRGSQRHVLLFSKDGIVSFEVVLLQKLLAIVDLDIEEGVAHAEEGVSRHLNNVERSEITV